MDIANIEKDFKIVYDEFNISLIGLETAVSGKNYASAGFKLMDQMWRLIKEHQIKNKGQNVWYYPPARQIFVGVQPDGIDQAIPAPLISKQISLSNFVYYKYIGPFANVGKVYPPLINAVTKQGFELCLPNIEIYGHWHPDENQCETELFLSIKTL